MRTIHRPALDALEQRCLLTASTASDQPAALVSAPSADAGAHVVGRYLFYNNSRLDDNNPLANTADDVAVAIDKRALLPGQPASFANTTSFSGGVSGIMIDVAGLSGTPTAADFVFQVGNADDLDAWADAPAPSAIAVRPGAGTDGSSRVTIVWPDNSIANQWLQVTVRPTASTGLGQADVFYWGSAVGNSGQGDSATLATVSAADELGPRNHRRGFSNPAAVDNVFDYNRDRQVNLTDELIARNNIGSTPLRLIAPYSPLASTSVASLSAVSGQPIEVAYADFVRATVAARHVFYNNSQLDGYDPQASAADDLAIAADVSALLPGQTSTAANYSGSAQGINGIILDILDLPGVPTADDFSFLVGNTSNTNAWLAAPLPASITVREGAGSGGAARVTIIWPDGAIKNTWLQATVKATPRTGLKSPDTFYFSNLDSHPPEGLRSPFRSRSTRYDSPGFSIRTPIEPITVPNVVPEPTTLRQHPALFAAGDAGFHTSFGPALIKAVDGTLLAFATGRWGSTDVTTQALLVRRSSDNGVTWSPSQVIVSFEPNTIDLAGSAAPVVDTTTGEIFLASTFRNSDVLMFSSSDNGLTWTSAVDITASTKVTLGGNPNPAMYSSTPWGWYALGPGHGIQIKNGPYAGRLVLAGDHRYTADTSGPSWSHVIYSDDHGQTWNLGGGPDPTNPINNYSNESTVVEASDGSLYLSIRHNQSQLRGYSRSYDGGLTWTDMATEYNLTTTPVHASVLRINDNTILLSAPDSTNGVRHQMTIWVSHNDGLNWTKTKALSFDFNGYSDMVLVGPDTVLIAYGAGHAQAHSGDYIELARFNLRWLEGSEDYEFNWYFNEQPPGTAVNIEGTTLIDDSPWDNRSGARADSAAEAPLYVAGSHAADSALALAAGSDHVEMTPADTHALQFTAVQSFTAQVVMRTSDSDGVIIGTRPDLASWSLEVVGGYLQFRTGSNALSSTITSSMRIDDGQWHRIVALRQTVTDQLTLYVDGVQAAAPVNDVTFSLKTDERVTLGSYNDGSGQLAFDIDTLRVTRDVVPMSEFLSANFVAPPPYPAPQYSADAPSTIAGLKLWLVAYDPTRYFSAMRWSDPMPLDPVVGTATQSAYDASQNGYRVVVSADTREVLYAYDPAVGAHWLHAAITSAAGSEWIVRDSNGTGANNFDFVQNTGVFTLSTFIKPGQNFGTLMTLFDTSAGTAANSGFTVSLAADGSLALVISGPDATVRFNQSTAPGLVAQDVWYHVAVVGNGAAGPVTFYVTPVSASTVAGYATGSVVAGADGIYATSAGSDLRIGARVGGQFAFNGSMVDQAIYDRALSAAEIQQLFLYTKKP